MYFYACKISNKVSVFVMQIDIISLDTEILFLQEWMKRIWNGEQGNMHWQVELPGVHWGSDLVNYLKGNPKLKFPNFFYCILIIIDWNTFPVNKSQKPVLKGGERGHHLKFQFEVKVV